ncbi:hypothetical protein Q5P01_010075 [Channa striata]|uniref:G protein-coupled receptor kinase n=1 Tax=Channa striata TaxID=64152 RepID=A0AA88SVA3_CHASR|nr:hypothetical protein Q5P01_010075 [Channa striata]
MKDTYQSLCELQPIGRKLFQQFLQASKPQYMATAEFLEDLSDWSFAEDETKEKAKRRILTKFCRLESRGFLSGVTGKDAERCKHLSDKNIDEIVLQWKEYEKQRISDKYFYEFRTLGKGGFGEVCAVQVRHTGHMYACKKLDKRRLKKKRGEKMALLEKQILEKVNSLFIVNLAYAYDNKTHLCLVMDLMNGGDLKFHIYELGERGICMERVVYYSAQITAGILHLHSMDIVYRDMKPENVLLDGKGQCRLSDLGLAMELPKGKMICQKAGTAGYMAPEILRQEYYRMSVDWWALGCSIYEMVAARLPFKDFREKVQNEEVTRRTLEDECRFEHKRFDAPTKDIIRRLLNKSWSIASVVGLVQPPWVPKANVVYAKNVDKFGDTSDVQHIELDAKDEEFFKEFSTGAVPIQWQKEMIDSGVFDELNDCKLNQLTLTSRTCTIL